MLFTIAIMKEMLTLPTPSPLMPVLTSCRKYRPSKVAAGAPSAFAISVAEFLVGMVDGESVRLYFDARGGGGAGLSDDGGRRRRREFRRSVHVDNPCGNARRSRGPATQEVRAAVVAAV